MNTEHIRDILSTDDLTRPSFRGVFPRDSFIQFFSHPQQPDVSRYVVNFDESKDPGSHWVAVEFDKTNRRVYYFDPYGLPPAFEKFIDAFNQKSSSLTWNALRLQGNNSTVCGQYCVLFCLLRARGLSFHDVLEVLLYDQNMSRHLRDHTVYSLLQFLYPYRLEDIEYGVHDVSTFTRDFNFKK